MFITKGLHKDISFKDMMVSVVLVSGLILLNTFTHQNSYGDFYFLKNFVITAFITGLYYWLFMDQVDGEMSDISTNLCVTVTAFSCVFMLMALLLELGTDWFSIYGQEELVFGSLEIPKKYFFDVWAIICFPFSIDAIFKAMKKEYFSFRSILNGGLAIAGLTIEGILLFRPLLNIWSVDLAVLNVATFAAAVWKYVLSDTNIRRENAISGIVLYTIIRVFLLPLQCDSWGSGIASFMYAGNWSELKSVIHEVTANASLFGTSEYLKNSVSLQNWLSEWNKPVLQLLYYGGWISVFGLLLVIVGLILVLVKLLGIQNGRRHKNWLIFATAVLMLADRAVFGTLFAFGIPYPIELPFLGNTGIMDTMAFTLILCCAVENILIQKTKCLDSTFVPAETLLGNQDSYQIYDDENEPYEEEILFDIVTVIVNDCEMECVADWYALKARSFCVFEARENPIRGKRFVLEFADGRWILPDDPENKIRKQIMKRYQRCHAPNCMEEDGEFEDEELDDEDGESI